jgi:hypothetical protein
VLTVQSQLNSVFNICKTAFGAYVEPVEKISWRIKQFLSEMQKNNPNWAPDNNQFTIKFSADGKNVSKTGIKLLNVSFCLMDDVEIAKSVDGVHLLGTFEIDSEDYLNVKNCINDIWQKVGQIVNITIGPFTYLINRILTADLKFLLIHFGLK